MAREFFRSDRVADALQRSLAKLISNEINDPRLGMVNINDVEVSRDLALAKVYVTLVGENDSKVCDQSVEILNGAANFLRKLLIKELTMRSIPQLRFFFDRTSVEGQTLSSLIDKAVASDQARQSQNQKD